MPATNKFGWIGRSAGNRLSFKVASNSRVLVAMLCSNERVGSAMLQIHPVISGAPRVETPVNLIWRSRTSQQCVANAGTTGDGPHLLSIRIAAECEDVRSVASSSTSGSARSDCHRAQGAGFVKVFGVYDQASDPSDLQEATGTAEPRSL